MNILKRFWKSFEHKDHNAIIVPLDKYDELRTKVESTKAYVPWQIFMDNIHNHQSDINPQTGRTWESNNGKLFTDYDCGCKFEEGLNSYSFSGHWCEKHCKNTGYIQPPIKQEIKDD